MKKIIAALCVTSILALAVQAEDAPDTTKKKHEMSPAMKELVTKYDANKDGKLDKEEVAKMNTEDKAKFEKMHHAHMKHNEEKKDPAAATAPAASSTAPAAPTPATVK